MSAGKEDKIIEPVFVNLIPEKLEPGKVYISEMYHVSIHACMCGCGTQTVLPFSLEGDDNHWKFEKHEDGTVSFHPSIGNQQFPCQSHYLIKRNKVTFI